MQGFVDEEKAYRRQDIGGEPHAADRGEHVLFDEFLSKIIQHEENDEEDNGEDQGKADAALTDDRAQRRPDEEHHETGHGERDLFMPGDLVIAQVVPLGLEHHGRLIQAAPQPVQYGQAPVEDGRARAVRQQVPEGHGLGRHGRFFARSGGRCRGCRRRGGDGQGLQRRPPRRIQVFGEVQRGPDITPHFHEITAVRSFQRVDRPAELPQAEHLVIIPEVAVIRAVELEGAEVEHFLILRKAHADEFRIGAQPFAFFTVKRAILELELQRFLVGGNDHLALLRHDDIVLQAGIILFVDDDVADRAVVFFFLADLDHVAFDAVVEDAFLDVEGRLGHDDIVFQGIHLQVGHRDDIIVEQESDIADEDADEEQRAHEPEQGNAGGLDGHQLEGLAQVAEGHDGRQQYGEGQGQGYERCADIENEPSDGAEVDAFADHVVDIEPEELQHQDEGRDKKNSDEGADEGFDDQLVQFFYQGGQHNRLL